jgi:hypothetical protein
MLRDWLIIALGAVISLGGIWRGMNVRNFRGNLIGGDAQGTVTQNYSNQVGTPERRGGGDPVAWLIGAVGILVAIGGIVLAHLDAGL